MTRAALASLCSAILFATARAQALPQATLLQDYTRTKGNLLAYIDAAPDSMMGFRPTPGVRTFAEQVEHIVVYDVDAAALAVRNLPDAPVLGDRGRYLRDKRALRQYAAASYDYVIAAIRDATPAALARVSVLADQPAAPAWRWLQLAHEHSVWTFGQIVPYLRLNGVTPPEYSMPF